MDVKDMTVYTQGKFTTVAVVIDGTEKVAVRLDASGSSAANSSSVDWLIWEDDGLKRLKHSPNMYNRLYDELEAAFEKRQ